MSGTGIYVNGLAEPLDMSGPPPANVKRLDELQDPAPTRAVGSTLNPVSRSEQVEAAALQAEVDETHDRVTVLELELTRARRLLLEAAESLRMSSVKHGDQLQSDLSLDCYNAARGIT